MIAVPYLIAFTTLLCFSLYYENYYSSDLFHGLKLMIRPNFSAWELPPDEIGSSARGSFCPLSRVLAQQHPQGAIWWTSLPDYFLSREIAEHYCTVLRIMECDADLLFPTTGSHAPTRLQSYCKRDSQ